MTDKMKPGYKATHIYAYIATEKDGTEGLAAFGIALVALTEKVARQLRGRAESLATISGAKIKLVKFTNLEVVEEVS